MPDKSIANYVGELERMDQLRDSVALMALRRLSVVDPEIAEVSISALGSEEKAAKWLGIRIRALRYEMPLALIAAGKRDLVMEALRSIMFGPFT